MSYVTVLREQEVSKKKSRLKADIMLIDTESEWSEILELKCQLPTEVNVGNTISRLVGDADKFIVSDASNTSVIEKTAIAITIAPDTPAEIPKTNENKSSANQLKCFNATSSDHPVYVIWGTPSEPTHFEAKVGPVKALNAWGDNKKLTPGLRNPTASTTREDINPGAAKKQRIGQ